MLGGLSYDVLKSLREVYRVDLEIWGVRVWGRRGCEGVVRGSGWGLGDEKM